MIKKENIILVDTNDKEIGFEEKMKAHEEGKLHRAFSIYIFNSKGELLLQKREESKYHSGNLWTNTCCSHPRQGETAEEASHRRLQEEMGFDCELKEIFSFVYKVKLGEKLYEHEYDHVLIGQFDGSPKPDPEEVSDWKWVKINELEKDVEDNPDNYTYWFKISFKRVLDSMK